MSLASAMLPYSTPSIRPAVEGRRHRWEELQRLPHWALQTDLDPALAGAVVSAFDADIDLMAEPNGADDAEERQALASLSRVAQKQTPAGTVGCLLWSGQRWLPVSVTRVARPDGLRDVHTLLFDYEELRTDAVAIAIDEVARQLGTDEDEVFVVRARLGGEVDDLAPDWVLGLATAFLTARHKGARPMPRFAAVATGRPDVGRLPPDVRIVVADVAEAADLDVDTFVPSQVYRATEPFLEGKTVAIAVSSPAEAAVSLLAFEELPPWMGRA